jgi:hypothetical protein
MQAGAVAVSAAERPCRRTVWRSTPQDTAAVAAAGWAGWRWLFLLEGLPSILLGLIMWAALPSDPLSAWMLPLEQREALHAAVRR